VGLINGGLTFFERMQHGIPSFSSKLWTQKLGNRVCPLENSCWNLHQQQQLTSYRQAIWVILKGQLLVLKGQQLRFPSGDFTTSASGFRKCIPTIRWHYGQQSSETLRETLLSLLKSLSQPAENVSSCPFNIT
jgi:hypothetical protein